MKLGKRALSVITAGTMAFGLFAGALALPSQATAVEVDDLGNALAEELLGGDALENLDFTTLLNIFQMYGAMSGEMQMAPEAFDNGDVTLKLGENWYAIAAELVDGVGQCVYVGPNVITMVLNGPISDIIGNEQFADAASAYDYIVDMMSQAGLFDASMITASQDRTVDGVVVRDVLAKGSAEMLEAFTGGFTDGTGIELGDMNIDVLMSLAPSPSEENLDIILTLFDSTNEAAAKDASAVHESLGFSDGKEISIVAEAQEEATQEKASAGFAEYLSAFIGIMALSGTEEAPSTFDNGSVTLELGKGWYDLAALGDLGEVAGDVGAMSMLVNDSVMLEVMTTTDITEVYESVSKAGYDSVLDFAQDSLGNGGDFVQDGELVTSADRTVDGVAVRDMLLKGTMNDIDVYCIITVVPADDAFTVIVSLFDQDNAVGAQVEEILATLHVL